MSSEEHAPSVSDFSPAFRQTPKNCEPCFTILTGRETPASVHSTWLLPSETPTAELRELEWRSGPWVRFRPEADAQVSMNARNDGRRREANGSWHAAKIAQAARAEGDSNDPKRSRRLGGLRIHDVFAS
jgi:hypothetical protein